MYVFNNKYVSFIAALTVLWSVITPGFASADHVTDSDRRNSTGVGSAGSAALNELSVESGATAQSYYVVNDNLYVLMQKPMTKAYGAFSMVPVIVSDASGYGAMNTEHSGSSAEDTLNAEGRRAVASSEEGNEDIHGIEVALNMNFRGAADEAEELAPGVDSPANNDEIADPLEPINRVFFTFNDKLYFWALKPAASTYVYIVPEWGRTGLRNAFDNIQAPIRLTNAMLQFKMHKFGSEFARFVLNSTVGIAGLFDIAASHPELKTSEEDLGQTFGFYGLGEGVYFVLPFLGPSSLRDAAGTVGDYFLDPIGYITPLQDAVAIRSFDRLNDTSFKIGDYEDIKESALDPYLSIRDMYKQYRRNKVRE